MIETNIVEVVVTVEVGDMFSNNDPLKIKWRSKALEVENKAIREDSHLVVKTTRTFNTTTIINLNTMPRIAGTELKILPISLK